MSKQLSAIIATRKQVEQEAREGKRYHHWNRHECPLCTMLNGCYECPMKSLDSCSELAMTFKFIEPDIPIEYILSFLIDLESCWRDMEGKWIG